MNYRGRARNEITNYIREKTNDNTVFVEKIIPEINRESIIVEIHLKRRINGSVTRKGGFLKVLLEGHKSVTGIVEINSTRVIEDIKVRIDLNELMNTVKEMNV